ncbi:galactose oxidase [Purpureocillium lavendulum]|uniref:Galactose oxidase n=1 Tax=Purpureocillium lavendulum TaxID=1247861 RepID=A0AB34FE28_9HYPO|nr:galactose oxidase [Purpureocillium lavendulum]
MKLPNAISTVAWCRVFSPISAEAVKSDFHRPGVVLASDQTTPSLLAAKPIGNAITRAGWKVTCDSQEPGHECNNAVDGNNGSFWHTGYQGANPPHNITVDMGSLQNINGLSMLPRQDGNDHGWILRHEVLVSADGQGWEGPVATGTWYGDATPKYSNFEPRRVRYVRLVAMSETRGRQWTSVAELNIYAAQTVPQVQQGVGKWGLTLDFPVVPVAGAVDPLTGKVVVWSAYERDQFEGSPGGWTMTSTWDPTTGEVAERNVTNIGHDMFCPGLSLDANGRVVVTGGNNAQKTSFYDSTGGGWLPGPDMKVPRGYQSSATCSDGRVFTIGGSWSGGEFEKNGEVYDPKSNSWTTLSNAAVRPMLTADRQGIYRADNHAWLFGWRNGTVFQAGPGTAMNWYYTSGMGSVQPAGQRKTAGGGVDPDSMCGNAVMFDATRGKILTVGGAPSYQDTDATNRTHIITLGDAGRAVQVSLTSKGMRYPRIYANAVALPDGTVFVTGGQQHGVPFSDSTPQLTPKLYEPAQDRFVEQAPNSIIRVYHSIALLLPDATVLSGGGGLCGTCDTNHFDAQIFSPRYLFDGSGNLATRPVIRGVSTKELRLGNSITVTTDGPVRDAALIRYGSSTHTVNTDQRRVPLELKSNGGSSYTASLPGDLGVLLPGYWMLFVMSENGVPSVAVTVKVLL